MVEKGRNDWTQNLVRDVINVYVNLADMFMTTTLTYIYNTGDDDDDDVNEADDDSNKSHLVLTRTPTRSR